MTELNYGCARSVRLSIVFAMPGLEARENAGNMFEPQAWVHRFGQCTPKTTTIEIPRSVLSVLHTGSLHIPKLSAPTPEDDTWYDGTAVVDDDVPQDTGLDRDCDPELEALVAGLCCEIEDAISLLGGEVVPKLGTVAPSDATWATFTRSLRCESASDVLTLIGASERAMSIAESNPPPTLALRSCLPAVEATGEFRVFVTRRAVVGLSQRDVGVASSFGQREMDRVVDCVLRQFQSVVRDACASYETDDSGGYAYDVYVDRQWRVWILDVAPWGPPTDDLLFSWDELRSAPWMTSGVTRDSDRQPSAESAGAVREDAEVVNVNRPQLRCVSSTSALRPAQSMYDAMPLELRNIDSGEALASAAKRLWDIRRGGEDVSDGADESESEGTSGD